MSQVNCREVVLLALSTQTTSGSSNDINLPQGYTSAILTLQVLTVSGTSPTLNVYVQNKLPQPAATDTTGGFPTGTAIYDDLLSFTQATTSSTNFYFRIVGGGNSAGAVTTGTLTAGTAKSGPIGGTWKVAWVNGGTSPSFAFNVVAELIP